MHCTTNSYAIAKGTLSRLTFHFPVLGCYSKWQAICSLLTHMPYMLTHNLQTWLVVIAHELQLQPHLRPSLRPPTKIDIKRLSMIQPPIIDTPYRPQKRTNRRRSTNAGTDHRNFAIASSISSFVCAYTRVAARSSCGVSYKSQMTRLALFERPTIPRYCRPGLWSGTSRRRGRGSAFIDVLQREFEGCLGEELAKVDDGVEKGAVA